MGKYVNCRTALEALDVFIDGEQFLDDQGGLDYQTLQSHLIECAPCMDEHDVHRVIKAVVARACANDPCRAELRERVVAQLRHISADGHVVEATAVSYTSTAVDTEIADPESFGR